MKRCRVIPSVFALSSMWFSAPAFANAQVTEPVALTVHHKVFPAITPPGPRELSNVPADSVKNPNYGAARTVSSAAGYLVGFLATVVVADKFASKDGTIGNCHYSEAGWCAFELGILLGAPVGAATFSALPTLGSTCSRKQRLGYAVLGATAGTVTSILRYRFAGEAHENKTTFVHPIAVIAGSTIAVQLC